MMKRRIKKVMDEYKRKEKESNLPVSVKLEQTEGGTNKKGKYIY